MGMMVCKVAMMCWKISAWEPRPYIGYSGRDGDEPMSWWFYKYSLPDYDGLVERTRFGWMWSDFWIWVGDQVLHNGR